MQQSIEISEKVKIKIFGDTHSERIGILLTGFPKDFAVDFKQVDKALQRRKSTSVFTTPRKEPDKYIIVSGFKGNKTTGEVIEVYFENTNTASKDYTQFSLTPRPGQADFISLQKYGQTFPGGGLFSGRTTILFVFIGEIIRQYLGLEFNSEIKQIGTEKNPLKFVEYLNQIKAEQDSVGVKIQTTLTGLKPGVGSVFFNKLNSNIARFLYLIPGLKALGFGLGSETVNKKGSEYNDALADLSGKTRTNNAGGVIGGISNGNPILIETTFRPTGSISKPQETLNLKTGKIELIEIQGKHDICFGLRAPVIVEAMTALAVFATIEGDKNDQNSRWYDGRRPWYIWK